MAFPSLPKNYTIGTWNMPSIPLKVYVLAIVVEVQRKMNILVNLDQTTCNITAMTVKGYLIEILIQVEILLKSIHLMLKKRTILVNLDETANLFAPHKMALTTCLWQNIKNVAMFT